MFIFGLFLLLFFQLVVPVTWAPSILAFESFDFDQRYLVEPGFIIKDHSVIQDSIGTYHIFYIKADESLPISQHAKSLGHATSTDLKHWTFHPTVIPVVANTWEENGIWAPQLLRVNETWYMFYTGVNRFFAQATGIATSTDLFNWTKLAINPVYTPDPSWAKWDSLSWSNSRDPHLIFDNNQWHLLTTAQTSDLRGAISHATSSDLLNWQDQGPLFVHPGPNAWHVLESANLHHVNGKWHLTFTEQNMGGSSYLVADQLLGPWDYSMREPFDAGHATELFQLDGDQWWLTRHTTFAFNNGPRYVIKFDRVDWSLPTKPIIQWEDPLEGWSIWSGDAFFLQPAFWDNPWVRTGQNSNFGGNSWIGTFEAFTGPLQIGFPGLSVGEAPTGTLRSKTWTVTGNRLDFMIGGGNDLNRLYLALHTADDHVLQLKATGSDSDAMLGQTWDLRLFKGRQVYLEIVDLSSDAWGHINVDDILEYDVVVPTDVTPRSLPIVQLHPNFPNPFNPVTRIAFDLPHATQARIALFDAHGRWLRDLVNAQFTPGRHELLWNGLLGDGQPAASGVYFYRLQLADGTSWSRSMVLLK